MNFVIYINHKPYLGESEETEKADYGGEGWHVHNHSERNVLKFGDIGDKPKTIVGVRCLKSEIDRIMTRMKDGSIALTESMEISQIDEDSK